ncbi:MAG: SpoIIE family protein phosphatase [Vulcanimicrobiaceae bacterium]
MDVHKADAAALNLHSSPPSAGKRQAAHTKALVDDLVHLVADAIPHLVWITLPDGAVDFVNRRTCEYTGDSHEALLGRGISGRVHLDDYEAVHARWESGLQTAKPFEARYRLRRHDGTYRWFLALGTPIFDSSGNVTRWFGTCTDIDQQVRNELALRFLDEASSVLQSSLRTDVIMARVAELGITSFSEFCSIYQVTDQQIEHVTTAHRNAAKAQIVERLRLHYAKRSEAPLKAVLRTGKTAVLNSVDDKTLKQYATDTHHYELLESLSLRAMLLVPIKLRENVIGILNFVRSAQEQPFSADDITLAEALASRAAVAMRNARAYEHEHRVAMALQRTLLPQFLPSLPGIRFSSTYRPSASEAMVGGDWYDAFTLTDGTIAVTLGDVTGHGLEAAALMGKMRELFRATAIDEMRPHEVMRRVNRALLLTESNRLVTALFGIIDVERRFFAYSLAGHVPPFLVREGVATELPSHGNVPLGLDGDASFATLGCQLQTGDLIAAYTDGLVENERNLLSGIARLKHALANASTSRFDDGLADRIVKTTLRGTQSDDVALMLLAFTGKPLVHLRDSYPAVPVSAQAARSFVRSFLLGSGLDEQRIFDLLAASGEAIANAIEHAYDDTMRGEFIVRCQRYPDELVIEIEDNGMWRAMLQQTGKNLLSERGRGIMMMHKLAQIASIERTQRGTRVTLRAKPEKPS